MLVGLALVIGAGAIAAIVLQVVVGDPVLPTRAPAAVVIRPVPTSEPAPAVNFPTRGLSTREPTRGAEIGTKYSGAISAPSATPAVVLQSLAWFVDSEPVGLPSNPFSKSHNGWDVNAPVGTAVYAVAPGTVYGNATDSCGQLSIIHGGGFGSVYAHLGERLVGAGDWVNRGQLIGRVGEVTCVGDSGVTWPHVHITLQRDNVVLDPALFYWAGSG